MGMVADGPPREPLSDMVRHRWNNEKSEQDVGCRNRAKIFLSEVERVIKGAEMGETEIAQTNTDEGSNGETFGYKYVQCRFHETAIFGEAHQTMRRGKTHF
jgi:hypothetical protein